MTSDSFPRTLTGRLIEFAKLLGAISIITGFFGGAWAFTYGPVRDFLNQWDAMQSNQLRLIEAVKELRGEDRVIRETPGMTYVSEPVYEGELIQFNFIAHRTLLGEACEFLHSQSIFTDKMNIPTPGSRWDAVRQITDTPTPLRHRYKPPDNLLPGRVTVYLILAYRCDGKLVHDQTSTAAFELLAGPRPPVEPL